MRRPARSWPRRRAALRDGRGAQAASGPVADSQARGLLALGLALALAACSPAPEAPPRYYLWAWQRSENLDFLDAETSGLALWTGSITLSAGRMRVEPRLNPVRYPEGSELIAVIRLEADAAYDSGTATRVVDAMLALSEPFAPDEYQIDFDATRQQRAFYWELLTQLRARLGGRPLSITALASWCFRDDWIAGLPIDGAVAMLYRMGPEGAALRRELAGSGRLPATICRGQAGYSSDEALAPLAAPRRVFLYHPQSWTAADYEDFRHALSEYLR